jgi:flavin reductase (DIM6/NTAB) family NADH-FMN oxidoreductase RutF
MAAIEQRAMFAVNLLHCCAQPTAELFASGLPSRFERVRWYYSPDFGGPELPDDAHGTAHCHVIRTEEIGDHIVVFGEVFRVREPQQLVQPLLYGLRRYAHWPAAGNAAPPSEAEENCSTETDGLMDYG